MYVCICNRITSSDLALDYDKAIAQCGTGCGKCVQYIQEGVFPGTDIPIDPLPQKDLTKRSL
jgi:bacterioferritin-associated ferredoxin